MGARCRLKMLVRVWALVAVWSSWWAWALVIVWSGRRYLRVVWVRVLAVVEVVGGHPCSSPLLHGGGGHGWLLLFMHGSGRHRQLLPFVW